MRWRKLRSLFSLLAVLTLALGCSSSSGPSVVVYSSVGEEFSRPIAERFEKETGIAVARNGVWEDFEETSSWRNADTSGKNRRY